MFVYFFLSNLPNMVCVPERPSRGEKKRLLTNDERKMEVLADYLKPTTRLLVTFNRSYAH